MPVDFEFMGNIVLIRAVGRPPLALTRDQFDEARKRGEKYAQETCVDSRTTPVPYAEFREAPTEDVRRVAGLSDTEPIENANEIVSAEEGVMAVSLMIELPASEIGETGYLRDIDHLQLPADRVKVLALEADGIWIDTRDWSALEAPPPYQRARVQVELTCGPTPLTAKNVVALAKACQQVLG